MHQVKIYLERWKRYTTEYIEYNLFIFMVFEIQKEGDNYSKIGNHQIWENVLDM